MGWVNGVAHMARKVKHWKTLSLLHLFLCWVDENITFKVWKTTKDLKHLRKILWPYFSRYHQLRLITSVSVCVCVPEKHGCDFELSIGMVLISLWPIACVFYNQILCVHFLCTWQDFYYFIYNRWLKFNFSFHLSKVVSLDLVRHDSSWSSGLISSRE